MLDPRISALEEDLDEVESSEEEDEEEEKVQLWSRTDVPDVPAGGRRNDDVWVFIHSQNGFRRRNRTDAVTVTTTDPGALPRRATDAVARPDGSCLSHTRPLL